MRAAKGRRSLKRVLVTATCQFPREGCDEPLCNREHTFEYVKTTKPQVYCPAHRNGWTDARGTRHGDEHRVEVIRDGEGRVVARQIVFETFGTASVGGRPLTYGEAQSRATGTLRRDAARFLQRLGLPMLHGLREDPKGPLPLKPGHRVEGRLLDPFRWQVVERQEAPGVSATTSRIAVRADGSPHFDPGLFRAMVHEGSEALDPTGHTPQKLHEALGETEDGDVLTLADTLAVDAYGQRLDLKSLRPMTPIPDALSKPEPKGLIRDATQEEVAVGKVKVLGAGAPGWARRIARFLQRDDPLRYADIERRVAEAREEAMWAEAIKDEAVRRSTEGGVSPVSSGKRDS